MEKKRGKKQGGKKEENTDENSGHFIIASSRPPERRPLERRTLAPIKGEKCIHTLKKVKICYKIAPFCSCSVSRNCQAQSKPQLQL